MNTFFITPDIQTAMGALAVNPKIIVVCIDSSSVVIKLQKSGYNVYSFQQSTNRTILRNSKLLLLQRETQDYINSFEGEKQFIFFKPLVLPQKLLSIYGNPTILNNDALLSQKIENKLFLKNFNVRTPKEIEGEMEFPVVLQFENGYAGNSTFVVHNEKDFYTLTSTKSAKYKVVEYIKNTGTYTNNCFCFEDKVFVCQPFFQYTGIPGLTRTKLGSCGNNFFVNLDQNVISQISTLSEQVGKHLVSIGYKGFFGIDFVVDEKDVVFVVEVNPRFTASISFFTQLEKLSGIQSFFEKQVNIFSDIDINHVYSGSLRGKRMIIRNDSFENLEIKQDCKSGIYKIINDEFVFDREEFFVDQIKENEVILFIKDKGFVATPETDIVNLYTLDDISEDTLIDALISLKQKIT